MIELESGNGELCITLQITRAETGLIEEYTLTSVEVTEDAVDDEVQSL